MNSGLKAIVGIFAAATIGTAFASAASAQVLAIGTTKGGATNTVATTIAKVISTKTKYQMRTQVMGGTQQYIPMVNAGETPFGVSNMPQYWMAKTGTGLSEGTKYENLRLLANLMQFRVGPTVAAKSDIKKLADIKGKRVPYGFKASPLFGLIMEAWLANAGLTPDDVEKIPAVGLPQSWQIFKEGKVDMVISAVGTGAVKEMDASIDGGVRYISLNTDPEAVKALLKYFPRSYISEVKPEKGLTGLTEPQKILFYDYMVWGSKDVDDEAMYTAAKAIYENADELKAASPIWRPFDVKKMAKDQGTEYHPGAMKFYKEVGLVK